jgi:hypothetical protein
MARLGALPGRQDLRRYASARGSKKAYAEIPEISRIGRLTLVSPCATFFSASFGTSFFQRIANQVPLSFRIMTMRLYLLPLLVLLAGCSTRQTLLEAPPLRDEVPQIETGYYKAYGGPGEGMSEEREVGALYLYRDEFLEEGVRFMGIRGVYFPEGMIWTQWKDGKPWIVGMPDPDGDYWAELDFTREGDGLCVFAGTMGSPIHSC